MFQYGGGHPGVSRIGLQRHREHLDDRLRIVVSGLIGSIPVAGLTLHYLQYVLGLRELGQEVLYLEDGGGWYFDPMADRYYDPQAVAAAAVGFLPSTYIARTMEAYGLSESWTFVDHEGNAFGVTGPNLKE
jgi:hypothetical protein